MSGSFLDEHFGYLSDEHRLDAYCRAVAAVVRPGMTVVDLGCGSGILGILCLRAGAARVIAIDATPMLEAARMAYAEAGFAGRVTFIRGMSTMISLPEQADVVICDQVGYFGFDAIIAEYLEDAQSRFLKPSGCAIPRRLRLELAGVESERCYEAVSRWKAESLPAEFRTIGTVAENEKHPVTLERGEVMTQAAALGEIDLRAETPDYLSWRAEIECQRDGVLHGVAGWFQCELADDIWMTNSPLSDTRIQRPQAFLPVAEPVKVGAGDRVRCTIMARPQEELLAWVVEAGGRRQSQSTWNSMMLGSQDLRSGDPDAVPRLRREGEARRAILGYCDGVRSVAEIEAKMLKEYPELVPSKKALSELVVRVLTRDGELN